MKYTVSETSRPAHRFTEVATFRFMLRALAYAEELIKQTGGHVKVEGPGSSYFIYRKFDGDLMYKTHEHFTHDWR